MVKILKALIYNFFPKEFTYKRPVVDCLNLIYHWSGRNWCRIFSSEFFSFYLFVCFFLIYKNKKIIVLFIDFIPTVSVYFIYKNVMNWCTHSCQLCRFITFPYLFWNGYEGEGGLFRTSNIENCHKQRRFVCAVWETESRSYWKRESVMGHLENKTVQVLANKDFFILGICHYGNGKIYVKLCYNPYPLDRK